MPAGSTYTPIATTTLGSAQSSVTFSSLGSYTDLILINSIKITSAPSSVVVQFNGDTSSNYSYIYLAGSGSSAISGLSSNSTAIQVDYITDTTIFGSGKINIQNYSNSSTYKTLLSRQDYTPAYTTAYTGTWRNTAAITSVTMKTLTGNFAAGSTFTLYGILSA